MRWLRLHWLLAGAFLLAGTANAQVLHDVTANCSVYSLAELQCLSRNELRRTSPPVFIVYADTSYQTVAGCEFASYAAGLARMRATIFSDSISVEAASNVQMSGIRGMSAVASADANVYFSVDPGRRYAYTLVGSLLASNPVRDDRSVAMTSYGLSRLGPGGGPVRSWTVRADPATEAGGSIGILTGILEPGDYFFEAHTFGQEYYDPGMAVAELRLSLALRDVTTATSVSTWASVKSLYRNAR